MAFPLVFGASYLISGWVHGDDFDVLTAAIFLVPAVAYGAIVRPRVWTLALPLAWAVVILGAVRIADLATGGCSVCSRDDDWLSVSFLVLFAAVIPLTVAVAVGILAGIVVRDRRDRRDSTPSASASAGSA